MRFDYGSEQLVGSVRPVLSRGLGENVAGPRCEPRVFRLGTDFQMFDQATSRIEQQTVPNGARFWWGWRGTPDHMERLVGRGDLVTTAAVARFSRPARDEHDHPRPGFCIGRWKRVHCKEEED